MKCVCGYEHKSGFDDNGKWQDNLKGDCRFIHISGSTFKITDRAVFGDREVYLLACPKCATIRMEKYL